MISDYFITTHPRCIDGAFCTYCGEGRYWPLSLADDFVVCNACDDVMERHAPDEGGST